MGCTRRSTGIARTPVFDMSAPHDVVKPRADLAGRIALGAMCIVVLTLPFAHIIALRTIALGIALTAVVFMWRRTAIPRPPLLWFFALLALLGGLSLVWSIDPAYSRKELKVELLYPLVAFVCAFAVSRDRRALACVAASAAIATSLGLLGAGTEWVTRWGASFTRGITTGESPPFVGDVLLYNGAGFYSTWLVIVYPFALALALSPTSATPWRRAALATSIAVVTGGLFTFNRAFALVALAETVAMAAWYLAHKNTRRDRAVPVVAALLTILLVSGLYNTQEHRYGGRSGSSPDASEMALGADTDIRWTIWKETTHRIVANPWHGFGFGRGILRNELRERFPRNPLWHAHNVEVNWGLQMGLPGVLLLTAVFGGVIFHLYRAYGVVDDTLKPYVVAAMIMTAGVLLKNQTDDLFVRQTVLAFWIALGAVLGVSARARTASAQ